MAAPKGNEFWKARSSHGNKPIFATPEDLTEACSEYFQWVHENPFEVVKPVNNNGEQLDLTEQKLRAMTLSGLRIFLDISEATWRLYREREDFMRVCETVENIIREQKFTGAAAGLFNPAIISRDLGLTDKTSNEHTGAGGGPINTKWQIEVIRKEDNEDE